MAGLIGSYNLLTFNSRIAKALLHRSAQKILKTAVRAWLKVAESKIPVWSGMSRGTLVKLADQVGVNISLFVAPSARPPRGPGDRSHLGQAQSTGRLVIIPGRYGFEYNSEVTHLAVNENADATQWGFHLKRPGPYHFRDAADKAFDESIKSGMSSFPWRLVVGGAFKSTQLQVG